MSWLNLSSIKGQITNFASEVLSEGNAQDSLERIPEIDQDFKYYKEKCESQEHEIVSLKKLNDELQVTLQAERLSRKNGVKDEESSWYWDPPPQTSENNKIDNEIELKYKRQIHALHDEISNLKAKTMVSRPDFEELNKLREENKILTANLEDLDSQHQTAMERLLTLKKELQKNFEVLKKEHEDLKHTNSDYALQVKELQVAIKKNGEEMESAQADLETLQHKYQTLERVHTLLRENAEKFQEENQDLHEEIFKLQEQVTKSEHELELLNKHSELSDAVPRDSYEELLREFNDLRDSRRSTSRLQLEETNIDDNAKSVIEKLKREINEYKIKLEQRGHDKSDTSDTNVIKAERIMQLYNKYITFELPVDYVGDIPSSGDNIIIYKLESAFKTLNSFKKELDSLGHRLSEKTLNQNHLQTQIDDLTTENDFLATDIQHYERELSEMKKNNDFLISEIAALKNTSKLEPIIETHEDNLAKLETELADSNKINKDFESEIKRIETQLSELKTEKISLQENLSELKDKYNTMLLEFDDYKTQTKVVEGLQNTTNTEQAEKLNKSQDEVVELKNRLTASCSKNEQLNIDIHIAENDKILLTKQIDDLTHETEEKDLKIQASLALQVGLENRIKELEQTLKLAQKTCNDVPRTDIELINRLRDVLQPDDSSSATREMEDETDRIVKNVENKMNTIRILQNQLEKANFENIRLTRSLQEASENSVILTGRVDALLSQVNNLQHIERELFNEITHADGLMEPSFSNANDDLRRRLANQNAYNRGLQRELGISDEELEDVPLPEFNISPQLERIINPHRDHERLSEELKLRDAEIGQLNVMIVECNSNLTQLNEVIGELQQTVNAKNNEIDHLNQSLNQVVRNSADNFEELQRTKLILEKCETDKEEIEARVLELQRDNYIKSQEISEMKLKTERLEIDIIEYKTELEIKDKEMKELQQSMIELKDKVKATNSHTQEKDYEFTNIIIQKEEIEKENEELKQKLVHIENEHSDLKSICEKLQKTYIEYKTVIDSTNAEKSELINLINLKHNESIQYHNEIQRLNHVILEQSNEFKRVIEEKDRVLQTHSVLDKECLDCQKLQISLKEKDETIMTLNQNLNDFDTTKSELSNATILIKNLTEKCENLDKNLTIHLDTVKNLTAQNSQLLEQEENANRELDRLRQHLLDMEDSHTQELMTSEQRLTECQTRLQQVEDRAKQTSTVYTSNSIRANQEVETLRNQIRLLERQRDEVQSKLSEDENSKMRNEAALTNLQIVLEQFQQDKERDIHAATEKIRNKMSDFKRHNDELKAEISRLNSKLEDSLAGLQAATRLGDQLETKSATINDLKEQVGTLQTSLQASEERYYNAISNQQDKVDKNLVKNLVLNYVQTANQSSSNRTQVLRILSTVLDFNQRECERLGLARGGGAASEGLAREFIRFLEKESRPVAPLPSMMGLTQPGSGSPSTTPALRNNPLQGASPSPIEKGHKRNPSTGSSNLLFQNIDSEETRSQISIETGSVHSDRQTDRQATEPRLISIASPVLENYGVNQTRNTEGAILMHVLKDM